MARQNQLHQVIADLIMNARKIPDPAMEGLADCYAVTLEDMNRLRQIAAPRKCANCHKRARTNSLYCSDRCKKAFLYFPEEVK